MASPNYFRPGSAPVLMAARPNWTLEFGIYLDLGSWIPDFVPLHEHRPNHPRRRPDVLRQLLPRQRAGHRVAPPGPLRPDGAALPAVDAGRNRPNPGCPRFLQRHQRLPRPEILLVPARARLDSSPRRIPRTPQLGLETRRQDPRRRRWRHHRFHAPR